MSQPHLPDVKAESGNVLPYPDQAMFLALRAAGQGAVSQALWIYEHPLDVDGVKQFYDHFNQGLMARLIETSPLPFGRHRWVRSPAQLDNFDIIEEPRSRSELFDWADEQIEMPLDPETGPGWRLGIQPFSDGSTVVGLVWSHCIADGGAAAIAVFEAISGVVRESQYPSPGSRPRRRAVRADLRQLRRDTPEVLRTLSKAAKLVFRRRHELRRSASSAPVVGANTKGVLVPSAAVIIDVAQWDAKAEQLGGNSFSLVAGFTAKVSQNLKRTRASDGAVTLMIPVSEREGFDVTGANAVSIAKVSFDPSRVTTELTEARAAIRDGFKLAREVPDEMVELLPLIPFLPKRALAPVADVAFGFSTDLPVSCSNMGDMPAEIAHVDGTSAEFVCFRGMDRDVSQEDLERRGGLLTVTTGRIGGKVTLAVISYQPGGDNSHGGLRDVISKTLEEFGLTGTIL